jgi:RNA-binding protein 26
LYFSCDADPAALSKYVIALIKKDKPQTELKTSMENQMEVFLQAETEGFITALFGIIETKEYVNMPPKKAPKKEDAEAEAEAEASIKPDPDAVPAPQEDKSASQVADSTTPTRVEAVDESEEAAAARSRNDRNYHSRRYPSRRSRSPPANGTRRFSGGRRSPPRGPRYHRTSRSRSPPTGFRRSRSRSPYGRGRRRRSPRSYTPPPPPHRRADSRGSTPTKDEEGANPYLASTVTVAASSAVAVAAPAEKRPRCRDYDEKGFCMRGDQCKFDHGNDAVVLEESVPPYTPAAVFPAVVPAVPEAYVPSGLLPPLPPLHVPPPGYAVHAVVPAAIENSRKRRYEDEAGATAYPSKAGVFDRVGGYGGRGGFRGRGRGRGRGGRGGNAGGGPTQLAVRNIPTQVNNIAHLNNHFARYGTLVNVQVQFEGDPASALVTFSNTEEATSAFNSAEAVLGNRFIKMFYHYSRHPQSVKDRLGGGGGGGGGGGPQDQDEKVI